MVSLLYGKVNGQAGFTFNSGAIPLCDTTTFTATVSGVGMIYPPNSASFLNFSFQSLGLNITSNHPQTLSISITSPQGTTLLLSAYNGAGGSNYTNCWFDIYAMNPIAGATAPFPGSWIPQGGSLSLFDFENADGIWTITIIDTACVGSGGGGSSWTPGFFNGSAGVNAGIIFVPSAPPPPPPPNMVMLPPVSVNLCQGQTVDLAAHLQTLYPFFFFSIYNQWGLTLNPPVVNTRGNYQAEYFDWSMNTLYTLSISVNSVSSPSLGPNQTAALPCSGQPLDLNSLLNTAGSMVNWYLNGSLLTASQAAGAVSPGNYQAVAVNASGCTDTAIVSLSSTASVYLGADQSIVTCSNVPVDLTSLYNTSGLSSGWFLNGFQVSTPAMVTGSGNYRLIASSAGCSDTADVLVTVNPAPVLGSNQSLNGCTVFPFDLSTLFNLNGLTTNWTLLGAPVTDPSNVVSSGNYQLIAATAFGCTDTAMATVYQFPSPNLGPDQQQSFCDNEVADLTALFNITGLSSTSWFFNGNAIPDPVTAVSAGTYQLIAENSNGCTDTAGVALQVISAPAIGADKSVYACNGQPIDLTLLFNTGGLICTWEFGGNVIPVPVQAAAPGTYQVIALNSSGCGDTATVILAQEQSPLPGPDTLYSLCPWQSLDLTQLYPAGNCNAEYYHNGQNIANPAAIQDSGFYSVVFTSPTGCSGSAQVEVQPVQCRCEADFVYELKCAQEESRFELVADSAIVSAQWTFGSSAVNAIGLHPVVRFINPGKIEVTAFANLSCGRVEVKKTIDVEECMDSCSLWIPTAFSPNNDGYNDVFRCVTGCPPEQFSMDVFNRYGQIIFHSNDPETGWEGDSSGNMLTGIYTYRLKLKLPFEKARVLSGKISVVY